MKKRIKYLALLIMAFVLMPSFVNATNLQLSIGEDGQCTNVTNATSIVSTCDVYIKNTNHQDSLLIKELPLEVTNGADVTERSFAVNEENANLISSTSNIYNLELRKMFPSEKMKIATIIVTSLLASTNNGVQIEIGTGTLIGNPSTDVDDDGRLNIDRNDYAIISFPQENNNKTKVWVELYESKDYMMKLNSLNEIVYNLMLPASKISNIVSTPSAGYSITPIADTNKIKVTKDNLASGSSIIPDTKTKIATISFEVEGVNNVFAGSSTNYKINNTSYSKDIVIVKNKIRLDTAFFGNVDNNNYYYNELNGKIYYNYTLQAHGNENIIGAFKGQANFDATKQELINVTSGNIITNGEETPINPQDYYEVTANLDDGQVLVDYDQSPTKRDFQKNYNTEFSLEFKIKDASSPYQFVNFNLDSYATLTKEYEIEESVETRFVAVPLGDWNCDGRVSLIDLVQVRLDLAYENGPSDLNRKNILDINRDGEYSILDLVQIRKIILNISLED